MTQQYGGDMYADYSQNQSRSPVSNRYGNGLTLNRQTSRQFEQYAPQPPQGLYQEDHSSQYDQASRFDRMPPSTMHATNYPYENQTWNYGGANASANMMGGTGRVRAQAPRRAGLPSGWLDPQMHQADNINNYQMNNQLMHQQQQQQRRPSPPQSDNDELIPTAIVIKNIPFAVKKEQLVACMTDLRLPLPYAFNYHFDAGVFRGLAFANFTSADETQAVIAAMNHMELQGRKLRVEYKKMLPVQERERIERDKREKRGQLQEQHQPLAPGQAHNPLHTQSSMASLTSMNSINHPPATSPSPVSIRGNMVPADVDMNDPATLQFYSELMLFKNDKSRDALVFPPTVSPADRRTIHTLAHHMNLDHRSEGSGESRCVQILRRTAQISPPITQQNYYTESSRRGLNRAATIDLTEARENHGHYHSLNRQGSSLLDIPGSPGLSGFSAHNNLRAAKSFADLRSYTPSPVPSTASFPAGLTQNISRYATDYSHGSAASGTPNLTPTSAGGGTTGREELVLNSFGNLGLYDRPSTNRPNASGRIGQERETHTPVTGAIGSQRVANGNYDDSSRSGAVVERQPRGPGADWGAGNGFSRPRQNGHVNRGSGEHDPAIFDNGWDDNTAQDSSDRTGVPTSRYI
ncbi:related to PIN4 FHA1 domain-interacting protein modulates DNA damage tolerance and G(2)/M cell cycle progression [Rhynchosporium agropyri]|uniref:Related to PIN4 FHA1 domain-interacting protein modulates DNA damage tolerance and G(2)/M cell cycle progression n=1 Tax=Rhynchosporium agropyri TaxID=914238 RepID=A0A1E1LF52_9HELO|nr:related to PIN4 FHA1 domain-interacting protein modulates DNA damage tolerance and G(2)/M cell cycle progression [Rhynchosporium agropyri]